MIITIITVIESWTASVARMLISTSAMNLSLQTSGKNDKCGENRTHYDQGIVQASVAAVAIPRHSC